MGGLKTPPPPQLRPPAFWAGSAGWDLASPKTDMFWYGQRTFYCSIFRYEMKKTLVSAQVPLDFA